MKTLKETNRLLDVVSELRKRCPWDRKQTHKSLIPHLIEEAYETVEAVESRNKKQLMEELGDVLLQVALHSEIAKESNKFSFEDVARGISDKMIHRHPHVFKGADYKDLKTHLKNWSRLKNKEKRNRSLLGGIPKALPALQLAQRYGEIAASVGFDWGSKAEILEKLDEEFSELKIEIKRKKRRYRDIEMEFGDLLFVLTRLADRLGIDAERALRSSSQKFSKRFMNMEIQKGRKGRMLADCSFEELDAAWNHAKSIFK